MDGTLPFLIAIAIVAAAVALGFFGLATKAVRDQRRATEIDRAVNSFRLQREYVEAKFFDVAGSLGQQPAVRWRECEWQRNATFARDLQSGVITAFVSLVVHFETTEEAQQLGAEGGATACQAAALFHYHEGRWTTNGWILLNMDPDDALIGLDDEFEPVRMESSAA